MNSTKKFIWIFFSIFFLSQVFATGVYNDYGNFVYYVNNPTPLVEINITAGSQEIYIEKAEVIIDDVETIFSVSNDYLGMFEHETYSFEIKKDVSQAKEVKFKLFTYDKSPKSLDKKFVKPFGDPTNFYIEYDNNKPELLSVENNINDDKTLVLNFNKKISYVKIKIGSKTKIFNNIQNYKLKYDESLIIDMAEFDFSSELYTIEFEFEDLANNVGTASESVYVHGDDLSIDLLTLQDDNDLEYNYDENYVDFFNKTIFAKTDEYPLKIKTNKPATCYFSASLTTFKLLEQVINKDYISKFNSADSITHTVGVDANTKKIWVACKNINSETEIVYLSEVMGFGRNLIDLIKYEGDDLEILSYEPKNLVTNNPFSLFIDTNEKSICQYKFDSGDLELLDSSNYKNFRLGELKTNEGKHTLMFDCFDVLANHKKIDTYNLEVDPNKGVSVVEVNPKYVGTSSATIEISLSDPSLDVECRYNDEKASKTDFYNFFNVSGKGFSRTFAVNSLKEGNNTFYVYCKKDGHVTESPVEIIYDTKGVSINEIIFVNGKYKSEYVGSETEFEIEYNISSLIPIKKVIAEISGGNNTVKNEFTSSTSAILKGNFRGANNLKLTASNLIDDNSSKSVVLKFDLKSPEISFKNKGDLKEIFCSDLDSGCAEIFYGFSQTPIDCKPNKLYISSVDVGDKYNLCVEVFDKAGNRNFKNLIINEYVDSEISYEMNESEEVINNSYVDDGNNNYEEPDPLPDPIGNGTTESNTETIVVIAAIVLLVAGVGSGGYYAYRKGYLNKELTKLGIKLPTRENTDETRRIQKVSKSDVAKATKTKFTTKPVLKFNKKDVSKSSYENHLDKLNKFIDSKVSKSDKMFGEFKDSGRGKVDGYHDTLAKKKTFAGNAKISKEDYDEFYEKSGSKKVLGDSVESLEKEAESFEQYLKKKSKK